MNKKLLWIALGLLAVAGAAYWFHNKPTDAQTQQGGGKRGADGGRPTPVQAAIAKSGDIDVVINALGTVTARNTATVRARVNGQINRIAFREGQLVKEGDLLAEIDPRPFQVQLDQANGQLARDQALLANARLDLDRYKGLLAKDSIARQQVDAQESLVRQYEGVVQTDRAQVDNAKLQLGFARVTAPVSGRLGLRQIDAGNMVHPSDANGIVVITQTQPIGVIFAIPSDSLAPVLARLHKGETLAVDAFDRDGKTKLATGKLLTVDNQIDVTTGTVKLKAEFANADNALFPNQFVNARLRVETRRGATLVPVAAIQRGTQGTFVYAVDQDQAVAIRVVTLGPVADDIVAIEKGLAPGEQVVIDGADKLRDGAKVEIATPGARDGGRKGPRGPGGGNGHAAGGPGAGGPGAGGAGAPAASGPGAGGGGNGRGPGGSGAEGTGTAAPTAATTAAAPVAPGSAVPAPEGGTPGPGGQAGSPEERQKRWAEINARIDRGEFGEEMKKLPEEERKQRMREMRRSRESGGPGQNNQ